MNNIPSVFWLVPVASIVALGMAWYFFKSMIKADEGTPRMREIAKYVRDGAMAYLKTRTVSQRLYYIVVETPEGNFGRDINGFYQE